MSEIINNASQREETLKEIIRALHAGKSVDEVKAAFAELLEDVGPDEIVRIEEALVQEGLDPAEIQPLCDVHVAVFRESLDEHKAPETIPGHPIFTYRAENLGVQRVLENLGEALTAYQARRNPETRQAAQEAVARLRAYDKHYLRKENVLFAFLEHTGFAGPSQVMWGVHNDIRDMWKVLTQMLAADEEDRATAIEAQFSQLDQTIRDMIYKEDHILFPAALERLTEQDWGAIRRQEDEIGYCYARPGRAWAPTPDPKAEHGEKRSPDDVARTGAPTVASKRVEELIPLNIGALTAAQIDGMLQALPIDITFVDEYDEVRYFSQSQERIFQRSPAIIGRKVENCHPPQSVDKVRRILDDFKAGVRDVATFWIQMQEMFIHIRYFAIRDADGTYRGALEVTQNLTPLRALEGERRLLDD